MKVTKNKRIVFLLTNLAFQALVGQLSAYSICKTSIAQTFGYDEVFLGMLEAVTIIGELIGSIIILFIPLNPVTGYFLFCVVNALAGGLLFLPRYIGIAGLRDFIMILGLFIQSFCLCALAYAQIIFSHYYDGNSEKYQHSIWFSLTFLGDSMSIIIVQYVLYSLRVQWEWAKMLWAFYMLLIGILMYFYLDDHSAGEVQIEEMLSIEDEAEKQQAIQSNKDDKHIQKIAKSQQCLMLFSRIWKLLKQPRVFLVVLSFGLIQGLFLNLVYWFPYYYIAINEQAYSMVSILGCSSCLCIGGIIIQYTLFEILKLQKYSKNISYFLLTIWSCLFLVLWIKRTQDPKQQIILICVSSLFLACPYNRISTVDPIEQAREEPHRVKMIFLLAHVSHNIVSAACTLIIGFVMKIRAQYFWHVVLGNMVLVVAVESIRKVWMKNTLPQIGVKVEQSAVDKIQ